jgi:hypothetical protein
MADPGRAIFPLRSKGDFSSLFSQGKFPSKHGFFFPLFSREISFKTWFFPFFPSEGNFHENMVFSLSLSNPTDWGCDMVVMDRSPPLPLRIEPPEHGEVAPLVLVGFSGGQLLDGYLNQPASGRLVADDYQLVDLAVIIPNTSRRHAVEEALAQVVEVPRSTVWRTGPNGHPQATGELRSPSQDRPYSLPVCPAGISHVDARTPSTHGVAPVVVDGWWERQDRTKRSHRAFRSHRCWSPFRRLE